MTAPTSLWWAVPFLGLLLTIAFAPLVTPRLWHRHYGTLAGFWSLAFLLPQAALQGPGAAGTALVDTVVSEYLPFALLLGSLYVITGGLRITGAPEGAPAVNTAMLAVGAGLASLIGTPGAAMLMIRPLIRANRHRQPSAHVFVFLILLVANVGGALTPIGNPPLFLGFLAGVPFFWPLTHLWAPTLFVSAGLLVSFYALDHYIFHRCGNVNPPILPEIEKLGIDGVVNIALLALVILAVLLRAFWRPAMAFHLGATRWNTAEIVADALLAVAGMLSFALTSRETWQRNDFNRQPMIEVAILFAGIFVTLIPVMAMIAAGSAGPMAPLFVRLMPGGVPNNRFFYWGTGLLSAVLDNAPSYLVFLHFAGANGEQVTAVRPETLGAISAAATFFGALTYLGNAPNLLIKAIAERHGITMPHFFPYIAWTIVCLLPWLLLAQWLFFT